MPAPRYKVYRTTTDKLNDAFARIEDEGDEVVPPLYWLGGRDWLVLFRQVGARLTEERTPNLREVLGRSDRRGTR